MRVKSLSTRAVRYPLSFAAARVHDRVVAPSVRNELGSSVTIRYTGLGLEEITMSHIADIAARLQTGVTMLSELERKRTETGDPNWGSGVEQQIIETELRDLEQDILWDPQALSEQLVRVRRNHRL